MEEKEEKERLKRLQEEELLKAKKAKKKNGKDLTKKVTAETKEVCLYIPAQALCTNSNICLTSMKEALSYLVVKMRLFHAPFSQHLPREALRLTAPKSFHSKQDSHHLLLKVRSMTRQKKTKYPILNHTNQIIDSSTSFLFLLSGSAAPVQKKEAAHHSQKQAEEPKQQEDTVVSHQEVT